MLGSLPRSRSRYRSRACACVAAAAVTAALSTLLPAGPAHATTVSRPWRGHPDRSLVSYQVRAGDTATALAVRYHAWTAELIALNHLGRSGALHRGQWVTVPVVVSAARRAGHHGHPGRHHTRKPKRPPLLMHATTPPKGWHDADLSRTEVHDLVARMARHFGVPPRLALAVAWQESGWQQRRVSSVGAIGVMQVMPDTGRWMRWYAGRQLRLRDTHDNIEAGVLTLRVLRAWTKKDVTAIAGYYQGLGSVRHRGWFDDTKLYVRAVLAHLQRLDRGLPPR
jgi:murein DD-endopeptidase MepM/ murein hydrolase activator NlpD